MLLCVLAAASACKDKAAPVADPAALRAQQALIEKREELLAKRRKLQEERSQLQEEMRKATESGGDTSEIQRKLESTNSLIEQQNDQLADEFQALSAKLDTIAVTSDKREAVAVREADMGARERIMAQREDRVAVRERDLAERERRLFERERETCAPAPAVVVQAMPRGSSYTRKEIDPLLARARANMGKRGLRPTDLPSHAQGLEREATKAMAENDYGKAYLAASQLSATIDAVKIDHAFVKAKIDRLQRLVAQKRGKVSDDTNSRLGAGIADVMQRWGDGDFPQANAKLNNLYDML